MSEIGCVIAIGGNENKRATAESILGKFAKRAGGRAAQIVVIPSASETPARRARQYSAIFQKLGAKYVRTVHAERDVTKDDLLLIENATGIFVTGGDQKKLMHHLQRTGCAEMIADAVRHGAIYAGTSAGAAVVSKQMIAGSDWVNGREIIEFSEGLGLVTSVIVDQHFTERGRLPRLVRAARKYNMPGLGIDEDTAAVWNGDGTVDVIGRGTVTLVSADGEVAARQSPRFGIFSPDGNNGLFAARSNP